MTQLNFDSEGRVILPKDTSKLICKCGLSYKISDLSETSICHNCFENLFEQLSEEDKEEIRMQRDIITKKIIARDKIADELITALEDLKEYAQKQVEIKNQTQDKLNKQGGE